MIKTDITLWNLRNINFDKKKGFIQITAKWKSKVETNGGVTIYDNFNCSGKISKRLLICLTANFGDRWYIIHYNIFDIK